MSDRTDKLGYFTAAALLYTGQATIKLGRHAKALGTDAAAGFKRKMQEAGPQATKRSKK